VDYDRILESSDAFKGADVGFCALGTTRGKSGVVRLLCIAPFVFVCMVYLDRIYVLCIHTSKSLHKSSISAARSFGMRFLLFLLLSIPHASY
jgi:hypothetical protein